MTNRSPLHLICALFVMLMPAQAFAHLQCAPYARSVSGIALHGNAYTWWTQAAGSYDRGQAPRENAVIVFESTRSMPYGHVAVVKEIVDARHVRLNHANWSRPGMIERDALAEDISAAGDWSKVRVWYAPTKSLGIQGHAVLGFIYDPQTAAPAAPQLAHIAPQHPASDRNG